MDIPSPGTHPGPDARRRRRRMALEVLLLLALLLLAWLLGSTLFRPSLITTDPLGGDGVVSAAEPIDGFTITGSVQALPGCDHPVTLLPGIERCLAFEVHNPGAEPITVTSVAIASVEAPEVCPATQLDLGGAVFSGEVVVPAGATVPLPPQRIMLRDTARDQAGCQGAVFRFTYEGSARAGGANP